MLTIQGIFVDRNSSRVLEWVDTLSFTELQGLIELMSQHGPLYRIHFGEIRSLRSYLLKRIE